MQAHENVNDPFERISPHCIVKTFIVDTLGTEMFGVIGHFT